ncbi:hypothetical protein RB653_007219 [Dictyostelium firmibasis]|uniref:CBS domain-containing protein n=1 Tax=Dictyostelium firmibasis TaxID=79012 RepID=A0AAN7YR14_9MYCE
MQHFLKNQEIGDIVKPKEMVIVKTSSKYIDVMELMLNRKVFSAPVLGDDGRVNTVLDLLDIVGYIIEFLGLRNPQTLERLKQSPKEFSNILRNSGELFSQSTIQTVLGPNIKPEKLVACRENTSCFDVIQAYNSLVSKVFILDKRNEIINLVSPIDILSMVAQNIHILGSVRKRKVGELGVSIPFKRCYRKDERVILIIKDFLSENFIAAPIVDDRNRLIANFSVSNIRTLHHDFDELMLPVKDFLEYQKIKEKRFVTSVNEISLFPLTSSLDDTLENTIFKLVATRVHRLWLVDDNEKPLSMITIDSILKIITLKSMEIDS